MKKKKRVVITEQELRGWALAGARARVEELKTAAAAFEKKVREHFPEYDAVIGAAKTKKRAAKLPTPAKRRRRMSAKARQAASDRTRKRWAAVKKAGKNKL